MTRTAGLAALLLAGLLGGAPPVAAQDAAADSPSPTRLTLLDAVRLALAEHPALGVAAAARDAAAAGQALSASEWWPRLSLEAGVTRFEEPMLVSPLHGFDLETIPPFDRTLVDATLGARWTLFEGGARLARARGAAATFAAAEAGYELAADATITLAVATYADVDAAQRTLVAHDLRLEALAAERERVARALEQGAAAGVDLSRADAALAGARADRVAAAAALEVAAGDLARLTGLPAAGLPERLETPALVDPGIPPGDEPGGAESPAVARARWEERAAAAAAAAARAAWWPQVSTRGAWIERGAGADDHSYTGEWQLGLRLQWELFSGGARPAAIARADAERAQAAERLAQAELDRRAAEERAAAALARALARADALEEAVAARTEVARVERLSLDVGAGVQANWLDAEADLLDARAALVRARADATVAAVELARATGALDLDWLAHRLEEAP